MTTLLEFKQSIQNLYIRYEAYINPAGKFVLALIALLFIRVELGYRTALNHPVIMLMAALLCGIMPASFIPVVCAAFIVGHILSVSVECALIALILFLLMFLLYFRFSPKDTLAVVLTPMCFMVGIPYVVPIILGLSGNPGSIFSMAFGVVVTYVIRYVSENAMALSNAPSVSGLQSVEETPNRFQSIMSGIMGDRRMIVVIVAFAITLLVVYVIRRSKMDHSWSVAIIAGGIVCLIALLTGELLFDTGISFVGAIVGTVISVLLAKCFQFFRFHLDYARTENVQFEDDEYYYYVKAVPKITMPAVERKVKQINRATVKSENATD